MRTPVEYLAAHVAGSLHVPLDVLESRVEELDPGSTYAVLCRTGVRALSAAQVLARHGRTARAVTGGLNAWRQAHLPLVEAPAPLPIDRQVQLVVGISVLTSVVLGVLASPWFLGIAAFFGAGLTFAGASGTCGLALVLSKMPWNQVPAAMASCESSCAAGVPPAGTADSPRH